MAGTECWFFFFFFGDFHHLATYSCKSWSHHHYFFSCLFTAGEGKTTSLIKFCWNRFLNLHQKVLQQKKKRELSCKSAYIVPYFPHCGCQSGTLWDYLSPAVASQLGSDWQPVALSTVLLHSRTVREGEHELRMRRRAELWRLPSKKEQAQQWLSGNSPNVALLINLTPSARPGLLFQTFRCVKITLS